MLEGFKRGLCVCRKVILHSLARFSSVYDIGPILNFPVLRYSSHLQCQSANFRVSSQETTEGSYICTKSDLFARCFMCYVSTLLFVAEEEECTERDWISRFALPSGKFNLVLVQAELDFVSKGKKNETVCWNFIIRRAPWFLFFCFQVLNVRKISNR